MNAAAFWRCLLGLLMFAVLLTHVTAQIVLSGTSYTQNFDAISTALPTGWSVYTGASLSSLGSAATFNIAQATWGSTTGQFANMASATGLTSSASTTNQNASSNRALGLRQTGSFGDSGAAIAVQLNTSGYNLSALSFDLMMLSVQPRSTSFAVEYGLGASPTSFSSLTTWSDPGIFGATSITLSSGQLASISNQSSVWIRIAALSASSGTGNRDTIGIDNFSATYSTVPEPSTYATMAGAAALLGVMLHRRRQRVATRI